MSTVVTKLYDLFHKFHFDSCFIEDFYYFETEVGDCLIQCVPDFAFFTELEHATSFCFVSWDKFDGS